MPQTPEPAADLIEYAAGIIAAKAKEPHTAPYHWAGALWEAGMLHGPGNDGEIIPTTEEAFSWRDQLATADDLGQRLLGELHAARRAAQELLSKEVLHSGSGRDGHLNTDDLKPLFDALRIEMRL